MSRYKIGIYGGTFNPPTSGHIRVASILQNRVDELIIVPAYNPIYKNNVTSFEDRLLMCQLCFTSMPGVWVSNIESVLLSNFTYEVIKHFSSSYDKNEMVLFIGNDWNIESFKNYQEILKLCSVEVFKRDGGSFDIDIYNGIDISSTIIRNLVKDKKSISGLVHPEVEEYIAEKGLYL